MAAVNLKRATRAARSHLASDRHGRSARNEVKGVPATHQHRAPSIGSSRKFGLGANGWPVRLRAGKTRRSARPAMTDLGVVGSRLERTHYVRTRSETLSGCFAELLDDGALEPQRADGEHAVPRVEKEGIEPARTVDGPKRIHADLELVSVAERLADERDRLQIGTVDALGLVVGVAHIVAREDAFSGQLAAARHEGLVTEGVRRGALLRAGPGEVKL